MTLARNLPRFRRAYEALTPLADRETWSRASIEAYQLERINALWFHAVDHVIHYRELRAELNLPARFVSLEQFQSLVPLLSKGHVRDHSERFISDVTVDGTWRRTGGSTSTPTRIFWAQQAHLDMLQAKYRHKQQWDLDIFDREAYLWGHSAQFAPGFAGTVARLRQPLEDRLRKRLRLSAYDLDRNSLQRYLDQLEEFQPRSIYAYPSAMEQLTMEAERLGRRLPSLSLVILTGEPAFPHIVARVQNHFGVPAIVEYGSHECGVTATESPDRLLHVRDDHVFAETLPRPDGRWDIVLTPLLNPSFPLLRYQIEDATDEPLRRPEVGFSVLSNVAGRNNDILIGRNGDVLHPSRFDAFFKYEVPGVQRFHMHQNPQGALRVQLVVEDGAAPADTTELERKVEALVSGFPVTVELVDDLERTSAGKHRMIISELATDGIFSPDVVASSAGVSTVPAAAEAPPDAVPGSKAARLRALIESDELATIMEAHSGLSAKIAEEAGFSALWASGLSISASLGVRDCNEASWTQVLEVLEFMSDATSVPILVDGDTGYGNFNNMRRLVQKLEQRDIAGVCIEDKLFPKTNSFIKGTAQPLADVAEFCGRIRAGCDARSSADFVIVARVEAFIAGWGLEEALLRAEAYREAGADAILIHSAKRSAHEVISFKRRWGDRLPVIIVPTKYYGTPTEVFEENGFGAVIWANHLMRSSMAAMQKTAAQIFEERSIAGVEDRVAPISEVFRIQGADELADAEKRYLPQTDAVEAIILAAGRGAEMGEATTALPKCMLPMAGTPILGHIASALRGAGIRNITAVRGFLPNTVTVEGITYVDAAGDDVSQAAALRLALEHAAGSTVIATSDVIFKKHVIEQLVDAGGDLVIAVDPSGTAATSSTPGTVPVVCTGDEPQDAFHHEVAVSAVGGDDDGGNAEGREGEWIGILHASERGTNALRAALGSLATDGRLDTAGVGDVLAQLLAEGRDVRAIYTTGSWIGIGRIDDLLRGDRFP